MEDQDRLEQVGFELVLQESVAQDDTLQEDPPLQSNPDLALGVAAAVYETPVHQIVPSEDRVIPAGSAHHHGGSAPPRPLDMSQLVEVLGNMQNVIINLGSRMDANTQTMEANAQEMKGNMQTMEERMGCNMQMLKAGQEEIKAELVKVKCEMQTMDWKMAPARGGVTESRGSATAVRTAMETGKVEGMSDAVIIKGEMCKLGQGIDDQDRHRR